MCDIQLRYSCRSLDIRLRVENRVKTLSWNVCGGRPLTSGMIAIDSVSQHLGIVDVPHNRSPTILQLIRQLL